MTITPEQVAKLHLKVTQGDIVPILYRVSDMADLIALMDEAHAENARILGYLVNELQGLVPAGKLAALEKCRERSAVFTAAREKLK